MCATVMRRVDTALERCPASVAKLKRRERLPPPGRQNAASSIGVARVVGHRGGFAARCPASDSTCLSSADHAHHRRPDGVAVEQLELFAGAAGGAPGQAAMILSRSKMRGTAVLEHHVVRDVHQRRHRTLVARARSTIQAGVFAWVFTPRTMRPENRTDRSLRRAPSASRRAPAFTAAMAGVLQRRAGQRDTSARDAVDAQAMRRVGRSLSVKGGVVQLQGAGCRADGASSARISAAVVVGV